MQSNPPADDSSSAHGNRFDRVFRRLKKDLGLAIAVDVLFSLGSIVAINRLPPGEKFILMPHGIAVLRDLLAVVLITLFYLFYTSVAHAVRRSIGCLLELLMFMIFVGFLFLVQSNHVIAVVRTNEAFVFVKPFPFGSDVVHFESLPELEVRDTEIVRSLTLKRYKELGLMDFIECRPVWKTDMKAIKVLNHLVQSLNAARAAHPPSIRHSTAP